MHNKLFPSQKENEQIFIVVREHWFLLFIRLFIVFLLMVLPYILRVFLGDTLNIFDTARGLAITSLLLQLYYLVLLVSLFIVFILYYLNLHIVSEERVVDIDQVGLLSHVVSELNIESIEDVTSETLGLFGNILDYGTVYIQTAGATERFEFEKVPNPAHIAGIILELYEKQTNRPLKKP